MGAIDYTMKPFADKDFNQSQSEAIYTLLEARMQELPPEDFSEMLRTAVVEDEWMLILLGAVLGFLAGCMQIAFVF